MKGTIRETINYDTLSDKTGTKGEKERRQKYKREVNKCSIAIKKKDWIRMKMY